MIPNLFEFTITPVNYKELGLDHYDEEQQQQQLKPRYQNNNKFLTNEQLFNQFVHHLFSLNFSIVVLIIELSLCEIENFMNSESRLIIWHFIVPLITILLVYVIPLSILVIFVNRYLPSNLNVKLVSMFLVVVMLMWLYFLSELDVITGINTDGLQHNMISKYISELTLLGVSLIAILGGIGTISNPFYELIKNYKRVTKVDIDKIVNNLKTTNQILILRQEEVGSHLEMGKGHNRELKLVEDEINAIAQLQSSLKNDLINATHKFEMQKKDHDIHVKIGKFGRKMFSVYCLYRLVSLFLIKLPKLVFHNLFETDQETKDALAITITKIIIQIRSDQFIDEDLLVNQLSFVLSGSLFLCSISSVVNTFHSLSRLIPNSFKIGHHKSPDNMTLLKKKKSILRSLLISELLGIYTLLTILLLRSNLPDSMSRNFENVIGGEPLKVQFVDNWFDKISILSCFITILGISINEFINHDEFENGHDEFGGSYIDEEKFIQNDYNDKFA